MNWKEKDQDFQSSILIWLKRWLFHTGCLRVVMVYQKASSWNGVIKNPFMSQMSKKRFIDWPDFAINASLTLPRPKLLK